MNKTKGFKMNMTNLLSSLAFFFIVLTTGTLFSMEVADKFQEICNYYEDTKNEEYTEYEQDCQKVCDQAIEYIGTIEEKNNYAFIFDIDETALSNYSFCKKHKFKTQHGQAREYRMKSICPAIKPTLLLSKLLHEKGCTLIFISSRHEELTKATRFNLENEGYDIGEIYLMPSGLYKQKEPVGKWKESIRREISDRFDIIGNIGDADTDFERGYNGVTFKLPNKLY